MSDGEAMTWKRAVEPLYDADAVAARVAALGEQITAAYAAGTPLCVVGVLKGSFVFLADLVRHIQLPVQCEFIGISSYGDDVESSGVVQITADLGSSIEGKDVLIVEDIVDTGLSMRYLLDNLQTRHPKSLRVCTLLDKPENRRTPVEADFVGFCIPNKFVVGYGLDVAGRFRNLPFIGIYDANKE